MSNKLIRVIQINKHQTYHVSLDAVIEFTDAISKDQSVILRMNNLVLNSRLIKYIIKKNIPVINTLITNKIDRVVFSISMGANGLFDIFQHKIAKKKALYLFDAWPTQYDQIEQTIRFNKTNLLFVSAKQSAEQLALRLDKCIVMWCPEGCNVDAYKFNPYSNRTIDILALGRKHECLHKKIIGSDIPSRYSYLYEKVKGEIIFPDRNKFIEGLASSKILICYPKSVTHPESSGQIETMTNRYLQGMASKVLLVGSCPKEMFELFGYNPVVNLDEVDPATHLKNILENFEEYIPLIEKNYRLLRENHQWANRWRFIKDQIQTNLF